MQEAGLALDSRVSALNRSGESMVWLCHVVSFILKTYKLFKLVQGELERERESSMVVQSEIRKENEVYSDCNIAM